MHNKRQKEDPQWELPFGVINKMMATLLHLSRQTVVKPFFQFMHTNHEVGKR